MQSESEQRRTIVWLAAVAAAATITVCLAFFRSSIGNTEVPRWQLWPFVLDLVSPAEPAIRNKLSLTEYFAQRGLIFGVAALIVAGAWGAGSLLLRAIRLPFPAGSGVRTLFASGLGLAIVSLCTLAAGLCGLLSQSLAISTLVLPICVEVALLLRERRQNKVAHVSKIPTVGEPLHRASLALFFLAATPFLVSIFLGAALPSTDFDVNEYHFGGPKEYFAAGRISLLEHNVYTSFPFATEMLTLLAMVIHGDWQTGALAGKCVLACFGPLTALGLYVAGRRWFGANAGLCAAFAYLATPWTYRISTIAYAEGGVSFYLLATMIAVGLAVDWKAAESPDRWRIWFVAGLSAGAAMSCKYPALVSVVVPLAVVFCLHWRLCRRHFSNATTLGVVCGLGFVLTVGPWLIKNLCETGNPVYPLAFKIFGGRDWDEVLNAKWKHAHSPSTYSLRSLFAMAEEIVYRSDWVSPLIFGLAPWAFVNRDLKRYITWIACYLAWLFGSCWLFTHRIDRFWVPLLPVATLIAGAGLSEILRLLHNRIAQGLCLAFVAAIAAFQFEYMVGEQGLCGYNDYFRDLKESTQIAAEIVSPELVHLNEHLPPRSKVLAVGDAEMFYAHFPVVYNTVFDRSIFETWCGVRDEPKDADQLRPAAEILEKLHAEGITHIYVNWLEILRYRSPGNYGYTNFVTPGRFAELQESGVLDTPWEIPKAVMEFERIHDSWRGEALEWGGELVFEAGRGRFFTTFQVYPVR